jgi:hypothetical protein
LNKGSFPTASKKETGMHKLNIILSFRTCKLL